MILENVQSHRNLEDLAISILIWFNDVINKKPKSLDYTVIFGNYLYNIEGKASEYLNNSSIDIEFLEKINSKDLYVKFINKNGNLKAAIKQNLITINIDDSLKEKFLYNISNNNSRNNLGLLVQDNIFSDLLHELTHYYDWVRGNELKHNEKSKLMVNLVKNNKFDELKINNIELYNDLINNYLNLPHEINARFAQAILNSGISSLDKNENITKEEKYYFIKEFISKFKGWEILKDKDKKRIYSRVYQFLS